MFIRLISSRVVYAAAVEYKPAAVPAFFFGNAAPEGKTVHFDQQGLFSAVNFSVFKNIGLYQLPQQKIHFRELDLQRYVFHEPLYVVQRRRNALYEMAAPLD